MLQRCTARLARPVALVRTPGRSSSLQQPRRQDSTISQQPRKKPESSQSSQAPTWNKVLAGLIITGGLVWSGKRVYDVNSKRDSFVTYELVARDPVSSTASIFHLKPKGGTQDLRSYKEAWELGVWNVHFKQPQLQIVRAYTPLPPGEQDVKSQDPHLRFLIRHDHHGEVSSYLHRLPLGSDIQLRGPNLEYQILPTTKQVLFLAGGTGIAPALQVANAVLAPTSTDDVQSQNSPKDRRIHIMWANRRREDCLGGLNDASVAGASEPRASWTGFLTRPTSPSPLSASSEKGLIVQELEDLKQKYPGQVTVDYFVNEESSCIEGNAISRALTRLHNNDTSYSDGPSQGQRQVVISGPEGFITYLAGPKQWRNGYEEQGAVSGILAHAIAQSPHNVKVWKI